MYSSVSKMLCVRATGSDATLGANINSFPELPLRVTLFPILAAAGVQKDNTP